MLLSEVGEAGQARLRAGRVAIVGCGALGCTIADLLARAGIGTITLIDRDVVEVTNLQRQTLYAERDAREGVPKAEAARARLCEINSGVGVRAIVADVTSENAEALLGLAPLPHARGSSSPAGVILDGTDNFETRYLLNDVAVKHAVPLVYGGVIGTRGMLMNIGADAPRGGATRACDGPCLRCVFEQPPAPGSTPTCDTAGVLAPVAAIVASMQAIEAMKLLLGRADAIERGLIEIDPWRGSTRRLDLSRRADCPCCAERRFEFLSRGSEGSASLCGQDAIQITPAPGARIDLGALASRLGAHGPFSSVGAMLVRGSLSREARDGNRGAIGLTVFADGRAIVNGTTRAERARAIYARYVGA
jgi:adenylyltransferase/sulfurtransferase